MRDELEQELVEEYPDLYELYDADPDSLEGPVPPLTAYGFAVGDGWYDIIKSLSEHLSRLDVELAVVECKEKFGGLRFYHDGIQSDDEHRVYQASGAIQQAEEMSFHVCEECGDSGELRTSGWYRTLCGECWSEEQSRRRDINQ